MNKDIITTEVVIVGAGLAGLTAAIALQQSGFKVTLIEKNKTPGGLCGIFQINDDEFVIACNDFNGKVQAILKSLGVKVAFKKVKTKFFINGTSLVFPPNLKTLWTILLSIPSILKIWLYIKKNKENAINLDELGNVSGKNTTIGEFIKSFAYAYGMTPREFLWSQFIAEFSKKYQYEHNKNSVPIEGPKALIDAMVARFIKLGGKLVLDTECSEITVENHHKIIKTSKATYLANFVITSQISYDKVNLPYKASLSISKFVVALKKSFTFPKNFHTIVYFPKNINHILTQIDNGVLPDELCFHVFPTNDLPKNHVCLNIFFYLPRGLNDIPTDMINKVKNYIFKKIEETLPHFQENILYYRFISVNDFKNSHHLSSQTAFNVDPYFIKPIGYDEKKDIYHIGNAVYPPGYHSGAAMLSASLAAEKIKRRKAN